MNGAEHLCPIFLRETASFALTKKTKHHAALHCIAAGLAAWDLEDLALRVVDHIQDARIRGYAALDVAERLSANGSDPSSSWERANAAFVEIENPSVKAHFGMAMMSHGVRLGLEIDQFESKTLAVLQGIPEGMERKNAFGSFDRLIRSSKTKNMPSVATGDPDGTTKTCDDFQQAWQRTEDMEFRFRIAEDAIAGGCSDLVAVWFSTFQGKYRISRLATLLAEDYAQRGNFTDAEKYLEKITYLDLLISALGEMGKHAVSKKKDPERYWEEARQSLEHADGLLIHRATFALDLAKTIRSVGRDESEYLRMAERFLDASKDPDKVYQQRRLAAAYVMRDDERMARDILAKITPDQKRWMKVGQMCEELSPVYAAVRDQGFTLLRQG